MYICVYIYIYIYTISIYIYIYIQSTPCRRHDALASDQLCRFPMLALT